MTSDFASTGLDDCSREVTSAIRAVAHQRISLSPEIIDRMVERFCEYGLAQPSVAAPPLEELTKREREVLALIGEGMLIDEIAENLYIGVSTVRTHLHRIRRKLDLKDRSQLVAYAYPTGLVSVRQVASAVPLSFGRR
ncbi:response regulator transcription factor [Streptomyces mirabilis]|uniref:response regulator transcription factor n=1 Tax=Streptomyces mirabilis TaxID=68239 RepID=UPI003815F6AB